MIEVIVSPARSLALREYDQYRLAVTGLGVLENEARRFDEAEALDAVTRAAIKSARGIIDSDAATAAWERALDAPCETRCHQAAY